MRETAPSRFGELAELHHPLARIAIGGTAGDEHKQRGRQELHQPYHAEVEALPVRS